MSSHDCSKQDPETRLNCTAHLDGWHVAQGRDNRILASWKIERASARERGTDGKR